MSQDFDHVLAPTIPVAKEDYNILPGHQVKWGVLEILPLKSEIEALDEHDGTVDVRKLVPWEAGIIMRCIAIKSRVVTDNGQGIIRELLAVDPNGGVKLAFSNKYMSQWCKIDKGEVERGWARQYNREKRKLVYEFPENWATMRPAERYSYWLAMLGGRYGFPIGALQEGSTFYAYFTRNKSENTGKYYSDVKKVYKDAQDTWHDACPTELGSVDVPILKAVADIIEEEYAKSDPAAFNYGANANRATGGANNHAQGSMPFDQEAGF